MSMSESERTLLGIVDDALQTYPLDPAPSSIFPAVMRQIEIQRSTPKFNLSWLDYALSGFVAGMAGLILYFLQSISLPPHWPVQMQNDIFLMGQGIRLKLNQFQPQLPTEFYIVGLILLMFGLIIFTRKRAPLVRVTP
ncbi:MAG: hypothetical protein ISR58_01360 [Anaerolineales bacterium]|nr:hypothetical protein [Chloroflexota bacterium]MBL6979813.1 hypothetical protein [Anaerolineales bacterium]